MRGWGSAGLPQGPPREGLYAVGECFLAELAQEREADDRIDPKFPAEPPIPRWFPIFVRALDLENAVLTQRKNAKK
jgi:hypothetical protein